MTPAVAYADLPNAVKNPTAALLKTFSAASGAGSVYWTPVTGTDGQQMLKMTYRIPAVSASQYVRLRGTNLPPATPWETDANGNPLADLAHQRLACLPEDPVQHHGDDGVQRLPPPTWPRSVRRST